MTHIPTIAFISTMESSPWGGSEELWSQTALHLSKQGLNVEVNVQEWPIMPGQVKKLQEAGCQITQRRPKLRGAQGLLPYAAGKVVRHFRPAESAWFHKRKLDFVVISQGDPFTCVDWAEQCHLRQIPYALIVHAAAEQWWPEDAAAERTARCYEAADACFFVSYSNLNLVRTQLAAPLKDAKVVRNPFSVSYDAAVAWPEADDPLRLACIGRLELNAKGQDILLDVLKEEKWKQRRLEVSVYGTGYNSATLAKLREQYGVDNILMKGFTHNVEEVWKTHHALIQPSRYEGLPITIVEALLCGRPVIVTNVAGNAELVEDGVTGFVAAAPTKLHLDEALERAWTHRGTLRQMGKLAGERVRQQIMRDPIAEFSKDLLCLLQ